MWFGNLVTMKSMKDLWFNESFGTFMAALVISECEELEDLKGASIEFLRYKHSGIDA